MVWGPLTCAPLDFTFIFSRVHSNVERTSKWDEHIMILSFFFRERWRLHTIHSSSSCRRTWDFISSSDNLVVDVMIWAIPKYQDLSQGWTSLPTRNSISLSLNSSYLVLLLEAFNKEIWRDILFIEVNS